MDFLSNLKRLMNENDVSQNKLAKELGISSATITLWKKRGCEHININTLFNIADYFNVSVEELVHGPKKVYKTITFTEKEYTKHELDIIVEFSKFLINMRNFKIKGEMEILDFSELQKLANKKSVKEMAE